MAYAVLFGFAVVAVGTLPGATQTEAQVVSAEVKRTRRFRGGPKMQESALLPCSLCGKGPSGADG
jgi:hypothetical protein